MSTKKKDYYELLGVSKDAAPEEIKKAFKKMAMKYHPDRTGGDKAAEEKFKESKEAYDVLSDPQKRSAYDQFGHAGVNQSAGGFGGGGFNFDDIFGGDVSDIFAEVFGGGRGGRKQRSGSRAQAGADLQYQLSLTLEEAVRGATKSIHFSKFVKCPECNGSGAKKGSKPIKCPDCDGVGQIRMQQGFFSVQQTCPNCRGRGEIIKEYCTKCHGQGRVQQPKTLSIKVPEGVDQGDRIRLSGEGEEGLHGGPTGDLYVDIHVQAHSIFTRRGNDLVCDIPISFVLAALGGEIEIPTLNGKVKLKIPEETQSGKVLRVRGKGAKSPRSPSHGDILCQVSVETPIKLNKKQKTLLEEFEQSLQEDKVDHSPQRASWLHQAKKFFENLAT